ncbi:hypothetical protein L0Y65_02955 [Candidatus Micrarchaeota archaeon]|nr:hypothetical protein [Candidatus Micrarchaeota archaeon]
MVKTLEEFKDEMRALRQEMFQNGDTADVRLVASWLDRIAMSLEDLSDSLEGLTQSVESISDADPCCCSVAPAPRKKAKPAKKAKKAKPAKKKKRR